MGLDMYLKGRKYIQDWAHQYEGDKIPESTVAIQIQKLIGATVPVSCVIADFGYWRKANEIHKWFVDRVQDGVDECQESYVDEEMLQELLETCETVLANPDQAPELLPCASGFFFGSVEYDEYYFNDIRETIDIVKQCLEAGSDWEFYYRSSW